jgi:hypothetical protein
MQEFIFKLVKLLQAYYLLHHPIVDCVTDKFMGRGVLA